MKALERDVRSRAEDLAREPTLQRLAAYLTGHLDPLLAGEVWVPAEKAQLSRQGGACPVDGSRLLFDPLQRTDHRCPRCQRVFTGEAHYRAWITQYQLWLSERAIHAALLGGLLGRDGLLRAARDILTTYAAHYGAYPNRDNILGPTRLFFSTYLESIWLIQVTTAAALLDVTGSWDAPSRRSVREMVTASGELIASFGEGGSNRQVWNAAATYAAGTWTGRKELAHHALHGPEGLMALLRCVDEDGFWHEGENYHLFALRGLLFGAEWVRWSGHGDLYAGSRLGRMYVAPLATLTPDLVVPARGDSPFGVSVRQTRFAELWEMGRTRAPDPRLDTVLAQLYEYDGPDAADTGLEELAEQEVHRPAARLRRDRLGWKALLWMRPDPPRAAGAVWAPGVTVLPRHGAVIARPQPDVYLGVECGPARGGHAHPDALHLSVHWGEPVCADFGTGSYLVPSLHWYRSALAHNSPSVAGAGQGQGTSVCEAIAVGEGWAWLEAAARDVVGAGTIVRRRCLVGPRWLLDEVEVQASSPVSVDLPVHLLAWTDPPGGAADHPLRPEPGAGHETGYDHLRGVVRCDPVTAMTGGREGGVRVLLAPRDGETLYAATAPGPPRPDFGDGDPLPFLVRRASGSGRWVAVYAPVASGISAVTPRSDRVEIRDAAGTWLVRTGVEEIRIDGPGGAIVRLPVRTVGHLPDPSGPMPPDVAPAAAVRVPRVPKMPTLDDWPDAATWRLAAPQYRRAEHRYGELGAFAADVTIATCGTEIVLVIDVEKDDVTVRAADAPDPQLDNEAADIHSDGVQCYFGAPRWAGYVVLPDFETESIRARPVSGAAGDTERLRGSSRRTSRGYRLVLRYDTGRPLDVGARFRINVVVNEMRPGRVRRAGQLALSGGGWVYLRGDREAEAAALVAEVV